jgi:hypothetical protein
MVKWKTEVSGHCPVGVKFSNFEISGFGVKSSGVMSVIHWYGKNFALTAQLAVMRYITVSVSQLQLVSQLQSVSQ